MTKLLSKVSGKLNEVPEAVKQLEEDYLKTRAASNVREPPRKTQKIAVRARSALEPDSAL